MGTADALVLQCCLMCVQEEIFRHKIKNGTEKIIPIRAYRMSDASYGRAPSGCA